MAASTVVTSLRRRLARRVRRSLGAVARRRPEILQRLSPDTAARLTPRSPRAVPVAVGWTADPSAADHALVRALQPNHGDDLRIGRAADRIVVSAGAGAAHPVVPCIDRSVLRPPVRSTRGTRIERVGESRFDLSRAGRAATVVVDAGALEDVALAERVVTLAANRARLRFEGPRPTDPVVGPRTIEALLHRSKATADEAELASIRLQRAARAEHSPAAVLAEAGRRIGVDAVGPVEISVLLASNRPDEILGAVDRLSRQRDVALQLVVGLHGPGWPEQIEHHIREAAPGEVVISRHDADQPLGSMLQDLSERADGAVLTKWDDDDHYGPDHLVDLAEAYAATGAEVVGKFAEFVYLEASDITVRRAARLDGEFGATLAGGTLFFGADWLREIGGWAPEPRSVDQLLLDATFAAGGTTYRTHGFQYVHQRRARAGHTWFADDEWFLGDADETHAGLALAAADIDPAGGAEGPTSTSGRSSDA